MGSQSLHTTKMSTITMPQTTPKKPLQGAFYGLSGYGAYTTPPPKPYIAKLRLNVQGKLSSYTRGGQFRMFPDAGALSLVYTNDFDLLEKSGITYSDANLNSFLTGNNPSAEIVATNGTGHITLEFPPNTIYTLDRMTIQGRPTAGSTQFGVEVFDSDDNRIFNKGVVTVQNQVTWSLGLDLT